MLNKSKIAFGIPVFFLIGLTYYQHTSKTIRINRGFTPSLQSSVVPKPTYTEKMVRRKDLIYGKRRNTAPIVNEEYKVIFFQVAKVASSEWLRLFMRLNDDQEWCSNPRIHDASTNGIKYLYNYTREEASQMMTSPEWTRAIFVRHPKPRVLSAFLDKAIEKSMKFLTDTCKVYWRKGKNWEECLNHHEEFDFFVQEIVTTLPENVHWRSISSRIDQRWWPYINYVGYMESLSEDAKTFLKSINSSITGISAWDKVGTSGWSDNERDCESTVDSKGEFLAKRDKIHTTGAKDKMLQYYTPKLEKLVETQYKDDLNSPYFQFQPITLFKQEKGV